MRSGFESSLLLMNLMDLYDADDIRYHKTVKAVEKIPVTQRVDCTVIILVISFGCPSFAFTICYFWLIPVHFMCHRPRSSACLFDEILQYSNHLGLFSEDIDFQKKEHNWLISHKLICHLGTGKYCLCYF